MNEMLFTMILAILGVAFIFLINWLNKKFPHPSWESE